MVASGQLQSERRTAIGDYSQEIVSKSGLKASRPGSRRRTEAIPVGGLNQWRVRGGSACGSTLCQGLSPQEGHSDDRHA